MLSWRARTAARIWVMLSRSRSETSSSVRGSASTSSSTRSVVSLDFADDHGTVHPQHYAFLVGEAEFDEILGRIRERGLTYWADPFERQPNEINTEDGGRGLYWQDPNGHVLEIITRPYGSGQN